MDRRKKVCFVVAVPMTAEAFLLHHFEVLSKHFDLYLAANFAGSKSTLSENPHLSGVHHIDIQRDVKWDADLKTAKALSAYFKQMDFDIVFTVTPKAGFLGILAAWLAKVPNRVHIFTGQVWHTQKGFFKQILMNIDRLVGRLATHVLVDGAAQREFLIGHGIISDKKSQVLGKGSISGVDIKKFNPNEEIRAKFRQEIGYQPEVVVFMFLGRLNVDKGILDLAKAFDLLSLENKNARLLFVGFDEENLQPEIETLVKEKNNLHFYGPTRQPQDLLQAADVFCLPSYREGFGTSIIEASAMAKPILCSDTYGLKETILDDETGLRHKVADVDSIFSQMKMLAQNHELRERLGKNGRRYIEDHFSADTISQAWENFFNSL
jgi:glycosyltransferase involved in cell wall biosynthesis